MVFVVGETVCVPVSAFVPLQPPEARHDCVLAELHVMVRDCPVVMLFGVAVIVTVGVFGVGWPTTMLTDSDTEPPAPVQVSV